MPQIAKHAAVPLGGALQAADHVVEHGVEMLELGQPRVQRDPLVGATPGDCLRLFRDLSHRGQRGPGEPSRAYQRSERSEGHRRGHEQEDGAEVVLEGNQRHRNLDDRGAGRCAGRGGRVDRPDRLALPAAGHDGLGSGARGVVRRSVERQAPGQRGIRLQDGSPFVPNDDEAVELVDELLAAHAAQVRRDHLPGAEDVARDLARAAEAVVELVLDGAAHPAIRPESHERQGDEHRRAEPPLQGSLQAPGHSRLSLLPAAAAPACGPPAPGTGTACS